MSGDNPFNMRLGRIFSPNGTGRFVSFAGQVRRAAQKSSRSSGGRSRRQGAVAEQYFSRRVIVKVHLVKMGAYGKDAQRHHLDYIQRDSAAREGETGLLYSRDEVMIDGEAFHERGMDDRHQFRVIVSPEDGKELGDLRSYTRNVMAQMERDLGTKLDWVAANHYDTANPHSHVVIRGVTDKGSTLIIPRDYISHGMREAAEHIATLELGPSTQIDVAKKLALSVRHDRVIEKGVLDDVNDRSYIVLDTMQGEALFVETGKEANVAQIERGMVVTAGPQTYAPKASDRTIADIAFKRGGIYSPSYHEMSDPSAWEEFIKAHVRRLEAMRRAGHAERNPDGSWNVPKDYLKRAIEYEKTRSFGNPVKLDIQSRAPLAELTQTMGKTWLDSELMKGSEESEASGFGQEVETLKTQRQKFLLSQKLIERSSGVTQSTLDRLEKMDVDAAGKALSEQLGKPYKTAPESGRISGIYREVIQRPSGKYAVIEKSKEFTLVPWRETMDRNLGKSISGVMKGQTISWTLTKTRGQSIS